MIWYMPHGIMFKYKHVYYLSPQTTTLIFCGNFMALATHFMKQTVYYHHQYPF